MTGHETLQAYKGRSRVHLGVLSQLIQQWLRLIDTVAVIHRGMGHNAQDARTSLPVETVHDGHHQDQPRDANAAPGTGYRRDKRNQLAAAPRCGVEPDAPKRQYIP